MGRVHSMYVRVYTFIGLKRFVMPSGFRIYCCRIRSIYESSLYYWGVCLQLTEVS